MRSLDWYSWRLRNLRGASCGGGAASEGPQREAAGTSAARRVEGEEGEMWDEEGWRRELNWRSVLATSAREERVAPPAARGGRLYLMCRAEAAAGPPRALRRRDIVDRTVELLGGGPRNK